MKVMLWACEDLGELGVFRKEAVARMDGVGTGDFAGRNDLVDVQIAVARRRRTDADAFVGEAHMHGVSVGSRVHGDGLDAELLAGTQDAKGDFAAIGYEDFLKHTLSICSSGPILNDERHSPYSTGCLSLMRIAVTVPARGDGIWFIVFIASMIRRVWPSLTCVPTSMKWRAPGAGAI